MWIYQLLDVFVVMALAVASGALFTGVALVAAYVI
jgi:hypothetical protein